MKYAYLIIALAVGVGVGSSVTMRLRPAYTLHLSSYAQLTHAQVIPWNGYVVDASGAHDVKVEFNGIYGSIRE